MKLVLQLPPLLPHLVPRPPPSPRHQQQLSLQGLKSLLQAMLLQQLAM
jgi:hypothetical protein